MFSTLLFDLDDTLIYTNTLYLRARDEFFAFMEQEPRCFARSVVEPYFSDYDAKQAKEHGFMMSRFANSMSDVLAIFCEASEIPYTTEDTCVARAIAQKVFSTVAENISYARELVTQARRAGYRMILYSAGAETLQRDRLEACGLSSFFHRIHIADRKTVAELADLLYLERLRASECCMIGNSPSMDITPAVTLGCTAVLLQGGTWEIDHGHVGGQATYTASTLYEVAQWISKNGRFALLEDTRVYA